ncbi:glutathione S-transferase [Rhizomicrobium palustre]|uniref:Glutathione S-transferase n=1 Tax=Rhizomicrobium palustre TaxID=189966 RepID=A0A846N264_9PROT|nr:glutathione S-transferase family protein [Rhizomicrobium palustre]NIK89575.1 glutathione S-transferase [Rhizomicrobium palustre]
MTTVEILGAPFSNYVRSALMALEEKGVPYTVTPSRAHAPEVNAIHPLGKIPCLKHGDFTLFESAAIATYIDRAFEGPALFPAEPQAAARCMQWVSLLNSSLVPAFQAFAMCHFFPMTADGEPCPDTIAASLPKTRDHLQLLGRVLGESGYFVGGSFTYADIAALPMLDYLKDLPETGTIIAEIPALGAYLAKHSARKSFEATKPPAMAELMATTKAMAREMMQKRVA